MNVLVTGGAGYVGSHIACLLGETGHNVTVFDRRAHATLGALPGVRLVQADLADGPALAAALAAGVDAVVHCAGSVVVAESAADALGYYANNVGNTLALLRACANAGVRRLVFSSSAAVYGTPARTPVDENAPLQPISPYGATKMICERILADCARAGDLRCVSLRYFNAAGADPAGRLGEAHDPETHLIPLALQVAAGRRARLTLYGGDLATPDGSCIRDYVHVSDLARAHLLALAYLEAGGESTALNCGYGRGHSVREVITAVRRVTGRPVPTTVAAHRAGDPPELVAAADRIRAVLGWTPAYDDLDTIVAAAWRWERQRDCPPPGP